MNHSAEVNRLVGLAIDAKTNSEAYRALGDFINTFPATTPFHHVAAGEMADLAHTQARNLTIQAEELAAKAAALESGL